MITRNRLKIAIPYILLAAFGNAYAFILPLQVIINRYLEALNTGSVQGLLMNLYSAGTGFTGMVTTIGITALAYLLPVLDPALMQSAAETHFQGGMGTLAYGAGLALASYILWGIGRSILHYFEYRTNLKNLAGSEKKSSDMVEGFSKHKNLFIPLLGIGVYGLMGWFGAIPLAFGMVREIAYKR